MRDVLERWQPNDEDEMSRRLATSNALPNQTLPNLPSSLYNKTSFSFRTSLSIYFMSTISRDLKETLRQIRPTKRSDESYKYLSEMMKWACYEIDTSSAEMGILGDAMPRQPT